ncbi:hypothetical protein L6452_15204 [Arctium lappa]|uniref:Uncharacterized protein n=1 Tax=Arctium lappa TaxID=4217 RepID=A0ACB9CN92_ARCLA|nr:hypothetical protein L6452_15204 [Arctium lappa]
MPISTSNARFSKRKLMWLEQIWIRRQAQTIQLKIGLLVRWTMLNKLHSRSQTLLNQIAKGINEDEFCSVGRCITFSDDGKYVPSSAVGERYAAWEVDDNKKKSTSVFMEEKQGCKSLCCIHRNKVASRFAASIETAPLEFTVENDAFVENSGM